MSKFIKMPNNKLYNQLGIGTYKLGASRTKHSKELDAIVTAMKCGARILDTAEYYTGAEELLGEAIKNVSNEIPREELYIVSKVMPHNAGRKNIFNSCENSLKKLGLKYIDLYLLHWRGNIPLKETVDCMEELKQQGKIRDWGVSNFETEDMNELWSIPNGKNCVTNQVLYHIGSRGIEYDLFPWCKEHNVFIMAYSPIAQGGELNRKLYKNKILLEIAKNHNASISQIMLAFILNQENIIPIPRSGNSEHIREDFESLNIKLSKEEIDEIDREYPKPTRRLPLDII